MIKLLFLLLLSASGYSYTSTGGNWGLLELEEASMEAKKVWFYYNPYIPEYTTIRYDGEKRDSEFFSDGTQSFEHWLYGVGLNMDINLLRYKNNAFFWRNNVYTYGTTVQVRHVGWEWDLGFDLWKDRLEIYYHHHSEHVMEQRKSRPNAPHENYPLLDELVLKMTFFKRGK